MEQRLESLLFASDWNCFEKLLERLIEMSDPNKFKVAQLKEQLQRMQLPTTGSKAELIARLQDTDPEGHWMQELQTVEADAIEEGMSSMQVRNVQDNDNRIPEDAIREIELLRRECRLMERELRLAERENEILRNSTGANRATEVQAKVSVKAVSELLNDFDGSEGSLKNWEKQLQLLITTYKLDENNAKLLLGMRLKGRALDWFHSRPGHIELSVEEILTEMRKLFDHR